MSRPIVVLTGPQRPHELLLLVVGILSVVGYLIGGAPPGSITATLPAWAVAVFYVLLGVGSVLGLAGCLLRRQPIGPGLEQGGLLIQAAAVVTYGLAVLTYAGGRGWGAILILAGWAAANLWRALQIQRDLRAIRTASRR